MFFAIYGFYSPIPIRKFYAMESDNKENILHRRKYVRYVILDLNLSFNAKNSTFSSNRMA